MTTFGFTKLVVGDLEKMKAFYTNVFGLKQFDRVQADIGIDPIDEIMLGRDSGFGPGSLVLLRFTELAPPRPGAVILGFVTDDLNALVDRVVASGGRLHAAIKDIPEMKVRVAFTKDPEGNLAELVQMI
jgi:predicted enzyme related to lactoylglutathione lyase